MRGVTPTIDALAGRGVKLMNYYSQQLCTPARAALMTGRYPIRLGLNHGVIGAPPEPWGLSTGESTLAQGLSSLGYATHMVGTTPLHAVTVASNTMACKTPGISLPYCYRRSASGTSDSIRTQAFRRRVASIRSLGAWRAIFLAVAARTRGGGSSEASLSRARTARSVERPCESCVREHHVASLESAQPTAQLTFFLSRRCLLRFGPVRSGYTWRFDRSAATLAARKITGRTRPTTNTSTSR